MVPGGEGNGTPLQYSCLENPMDGGAWWAIVHGVAESRTRLSDFTFTFHQEDLLFIYSLYNGLHLLPSKLMLSDLFLAGCGFRCCVVFPLWRAGATLWLWCVASHCSALSLQSTRSRARGLYMPRGLTSCGSGLYAQAQQSWGTGLVALQHVGSSQIGDRTCVSGIDRQVLYH